MHATNTTAAGAGGKPGRADVERLLARARMGDAMARGELLSRFYSELHGHASHCMRGQPKNHTVQATALLHEAVLRLENSSAADWSDEQHFIRVAIKAMRRILVDHARDKARLKRSPEGAAVPLDSLMLPYERQGWDLLVLDEALDALEKRDPRMCRAVEMRFFGGLGAADVARLLGMPQSTFGAEWSYTLAWLRKRIA